eukprot:TRINITY_DN35518_c0_g1_i1.p1 TRINITY_DN35518_c0_g1~~TRINITY_DN35518_c0_g1_i1.p1  ORF type:complete len:269 (-),score=55.60 TRINITY_DN35518_c0_g1_i1:157-963(-)
MLDTFQYVSTYLPWKLSVSKPFREVSLIHTISHFTVSRGKRGRVSVRARGADNRGTEGNEGDRETQDLLAEIAMLEIRKVRVSEFVKEKSAQLTQIAKQANTEFQEIADYTLKDMDEAGLKVMENVEAEVQACEEEFASAWAEFKTDNKSVDDFEAKMRKDRSSGLFFKSLYAPGKKWKDMPLKQRRSAQLEAKKVEEVSKQSFGFTFRRNVYIFLILVLTLGVIDLVSSGSESWPKIVIYSFILVMLIAQLTYETKLSSTTNDAEKR